MNSAPTPVAPGVWRRRRAAVFARKFCGMLWEVAMRLRRKAGNRS